MKLENAVGRSTEEWWGANPDAAVPPRVRLRVFERHNGQCYLTGRKIRPGDKWELEHVHALSLGGEHREMNLAPALKEPHKIKTREDVALKAKLHRIAKKHNGIKPKSRFAGSKDSKWKKKLNGEVVER